MNLKKQNLFWLILGVIITALVFLFGQGIIMKPRILVSYGAIDYKIPVKYQMELLQWRMMLVAEDLAKETMNKMKALLREYGFSEDKIELIITALTKKEGKSTDIKLDLKLNEQNIIKKILAKINSELLTEAMMKSFELPNGALFFEINNNGFASARNAHIKIILSGKAYNVLIDSENKLKDSVETGSELSFDYEQIAPNSKIKGIVWFSPGKIDETLEENVISVSFDGGTIRTKFSVDKFYLSKN